MREDVTPEHAAWLTAFFVAGAIGINLDKPELAPLAGSAESIVDLFMKGIIK